MLLEFKQLWSVPSNAFNQFLIYLPLNWGAQKVSRTLDLSHCDPVSNEPPGARNGPWRRDWTGHETAKATRKRLVTWSKTQPFFHPERDLIIGTVCIFCVYLYAPQKLKNHPLIPLGGLSTIKTPIDLGGNGLAQETHTCGWFCRDFPGIVFEFVWCFICFRWLYSWKVPVFLHAFTKLSGFAWMLDVMAIVHCHRAK